VSQAARQLLDERQVCGVLYRFAQGVDTRDWDLLQSVFAPEFTYDYTSHRPGSEGTQTREAWTAHARLRFETMTATQHSMTNPRVVLDGEEAEVRMYVEAWHVASVDGHEDWCTIGGEYHNRLRRTSDGWEIIRLRLERRWTVGNPAVLDLPTG